MFKKMLFAALLTVTSIVYAQSSMVPTTPHGVDRSLSALTQDQQMQIRDQVETLAQDSLRIVQAIDHGQLGMVWDKASSVAKMFKRADFVRKIYIDRSKLGAPSFRKQVAITFSQSKGGEVPAGLYISVDYSTQFARENKPVRELVSYHLDNDKVWRVSGYSVR
ncbi:DUF4019 domain-containing protein [Rhodanobacter sp. Col0626]|uniref:DUF4019 domain-containing protein n=1 Tax=Rhodanobacter sp. Col0626 TaxID=3415679 RepID=UPI003CEEA5A0